MSSRSNSCTCPTKVTVVSLWHHQQPSSRHLGSQLMPCRCRKIEGKNEKEDQVKLSLLSTFQMLPYLPPGVGDHSTNSFLSTCGIHLVQSFRYIRSRCTYGLQSSTYCRQILTAGPSKCLAAVSRDLSLRASKTNKSTTLNTYPSPSTR